MGLLSATPVVISSLRGLEFPKSRSRQRHFENYGLGFAGNRGIHHQLHDCHLRSRVLLPLYTTKCFPLITPCSKHKNLSISASVVGRNFSSAESPKLHVLKLGLREIERIVVIGRDFGSAGGGAMGGGGMLDLEKQFAQYGAYHSNKINVLIHMVFVWPILFTAFTLLAYTQPLAPQTPFMATLPYHQYMVLNYSFVSAAVYALFYICLERKSGSLAAFLVLCCWIGANAVAQHVPYTLGWKIVAVSQVVCWTFQFIGHGVFEGRAPALLDNLAQAFLMAPFFVLLELLHLIFHYEPYLGFTKSVQNKVGVQITEFRTKKAKGKRME